MMERADQICQQTHVARFEKKTLVFKYGISRYPPQPFRGANQATTDF